MKHEYYLSLDEWCICLGRKFLKMANKETKLSVDVSLTETELFKDMVKLLKELHETGNDEQKQKIERFIREKLETNRG